jgi:hypothetical protein
LEAARAASTIVLPDDCGVRHGDFREVAKELSMRY